MHTLKAPSCHANAQSSDRMHASGPHTGTHAWLDVLPALTLVAWGLRAWPEHATGICMSGCFVRVGSVIHLISILRRLGVRASQPPSEVGAWCEKRLLMHGHCERTASTAGLGDVAITPYSVNWQCKLASWTEQCTGFPNVCTYPIEEAGPTVT